MKMRRSCLVLALAACVSAYDIIKEYAGDSFFDDWDFYGSWDNLTLGDVWWLNEVDAMSDGLTYVNGDGNAIIRVDNYTNVPFNFKRNSVRITTKDFYALGSLWIIDALHLPFGCSVWPAFWSKGALWPNDGEIDIIEAVNRMPSNQMALHTTGGCFHTTPPNQLGQSMGLGAGNVGGSGLNGNGENASDCSTGSGCVVTETKTASFGSAFAQNGGGVWATQFDVSGIYMWYWPRNEVPQSIQGATSSSGIGLDDWGAPSASYPSTSCDIATFFTPQQLVLDITLCGDWAGVPAVYNSTCSNTGSTGLCYNDNVIGDGSKYDDAYFEIQYLRAYTTGLPNPTPTAALDNQPSASVSTSASSAGGSGLSRGARTEWLAFAWVTLCLGVVVGVMITF